MNDSKHRGSVSSHFSSSSDSDYTSSEDDETVPEIFHSKEEVPLSTGNPSLKKMRRPSGLPPPPPRRKSTNMLAPKSESCKNESENGSKSDEFENFSFNRGEEINAKAKNSMNTLKINTNPNETTALSTPTKPNISLKEQATASRLSSLRRIRAAREKKKIIKQSSVTSPGFIIGSTRHLRRIADGPQINKKSSAGPKKKRLSSGNYERQNNKSEVNQKSNLKGSITDEPLLKVPKYKN